jgi:hypothetical protein
MPETTFRSEVSAGMPMNRELGRAERLKERKEHFSQKPTERRYLHKLGHSYFTSTNDALQILFFHAR